LENNMTVKNQTLIASIFIAATLSGCGEREVREERTEQAPNETNAATAQRAHSTARATNTPTAPQTGTEAASSTAPLPQTDASLTSEPAAIAAATTTSTVGAAATTPAPVTTGSGLARTASAQLEQLAKADNAQIATAETRDRALQILRSTSEQMRTDTSISEAQRKATDFSWLDKALETFPENFEVGNAQSARLAIQQAREHLEGGAEMMESKGVGGKQ
jgi:glucose/arabinose dehydrogenase